MSRHDTAAKFTSPATTPQSPGFVLPANYQPRVAGYVPGPFIEPVTVTPTHWRWRNARTYIIRGSNGHDYRCLRVSSGSDFVGYWAIELLGVPLPIEGE